MIGWLPTFLANLTKSCQLFILPNVGLPTIGNAKYMYQTNYALKSFLSIVSVKCSSFGV